MVPRMRVPAPHLLARDLYVGGPRLEGGNKGTSEWLIATVILLFSGTNLVNSQQIAFEGCRHTIYPLDKIQSIYKHPLRAYYAQPTVLKK